MHWIVGTVISAVVSSLLVISFLSVIIKRMELYISHRNFGIKRIYSQGQNIKSMQSAIDDASEIKVIAFTAINFLTVNRKRLTKFIVRQGNLQLLLAKSDSDLIKEALLMEGREKSGSNELNVSLDIVNAILCDAKVAAHGSPIGSIEVRYYSTEIRNQMISCIDKKENKAQSWLSVLIPPDSAMDSLMIEFDDSEKCLRYFNTIWELHP